MKCYFAHPISIYNTPKEEALINLISTSRDLDFPTVVNPNSKFNEEQYKINGMNHFLSIVDECDFLIIYPFEDNTLGAGIVKEAFRAIETGKKVYRINPSSFNIYEVKNLKNCLTIDETREKLKFIKLENEKNII